MKVPPRVWSVYGHVRTLPPCESPLAVWCFSSKAEADAERVFALAELSPQLLAVRLVVHKLYDFITVQRTRADHPALVERYGAFHANLLAIDDALIGYFDALATLLRGDFRCVWEPGAEPLGVQPAAALGLLRARATADQRDWFTAAPAEGPAAPVDPCQLPPYHSKQPADAEPYRRPEGS